MFLEGTDPEAQNEKSPHIASPEKTNLLETTQEQKTSSPNAENDKIQKFLFDSSKYSEFPENFEDLSMGQVKRMFQDFQKMKSDYASLTERVKHQNLNL